MPDPTTDPIPNQPTDAADPDDPATRASRERLASGPDGTPGYARLARRFWRSLPASPRCKMCTSPFAGPFAPILRAVGKGPWPNNPRYCGGCFRSLMTHHAGAEIECSLLFADVRGSTEMAEGMRPAAFRTLMDRFYRVASDRLVEHEAVVDKFVGDEVVAIFVPGLTGGQHAAQAIAAGRDLLSSVRMGGEVALSIGVGINTGVAYVGAVGTDAHVEFTAMGDPVNVAARLAAAAGAGELLVAASTAQAAGMPDHGIERRTLELKGKSMPVDVWVLTAT